MSRRAARAPRPIRVPAPIVVTGSEPSIDCNTAMAVDGVSFEDADIVNITSVTSDADTTMPSDSIENNNALGATHLDFEGESDFLFSDDNAQTLPMDIATATAIAAVNPGAVATSVQPSVAEAAAVAEIPEDPVQVYEDRVKNGVYDSVVKQMMQQGMPPCLADASYNTDFHRIIERRGGKYTYTLPGGTEYRAILVGEICPTSLGTVMSAKGNHYPGSTVFTPCDDKAKVKDILVLRAPTNATPKMKMLFNNQIGTLNEIRIADEEEEKVDGRKFIAKEWLRASGGDGENNILDLIAVHMPLKYSATTDNPTAKPRITKQVVPDLSLPADSTLKVDATNQPPTAEHELKLGALYDPKLLPDYGGPYFQLKKNKLVQLDVRDEHKKLIAPWKFYDALRPGTLVMIEATLNCFIMSDEGRIRKIYQINGSKFRVLDSSAEAIETRRAPILPDFANKRDLNAEVSDAFESIVVAKRIRIA